MKNRLYINIGVFQNINFDRKVTLPTGIIICRDIVATFNWGKIPRVFVIICKENAEHYRKFFYELWNKSSD